MKNRQKNGSTDSKQNVGTATPTLLNWITAKNADSTSALNVESVLANYLETHGTQLRRRLAPLLLSFLKTQKTEWGYLAVNTKEICRRVNGDVSRDFCHTVNVETSKKTAKSYSEKRGCAMVPLAKIPCKIKFMQVRRVLFWMAKIGVIVTFRGKALDLKNMGKHKVVSTDRYRFFQCVGE